MKKFYLFFALVLFCVFGNVDSYALVADESAGVIPDNTVDKEDVMSNEEISVRKSVFNFDYNNADNFVDSDCVVPQDKYATGDMSVGCVNRYVCKYSKADSSSRRKIDGIVETDSGGLFLLLYNPDRVGEMQYMLVCYDSILKNTNVLIDGYSQCAFTGTENTTLYRTDCEDEINSYSFSVRAGYAGRSFSFAGGTYSITDYFVSTIPVFDVTSDTLLDDVNAYIESNGEDVSGAINSDDLGGGIDFGSIKKDDSIPYPTVNAMGSFTSDEDSVFTPNANMGLTISAEAGTDWRGSLTYDIQVGASCTDKNGKAFSLSYQYFYYGEPWSMTADAVIFGNDDYLFGRVSRWLNTSSNIKHVSMLYVRVRYRIDNKCSNWVQVKYSPGTETPSGDLVDSEGNHVDNPDYDNNPFDNGTDVGFNVSGYLGDNVSFLYEYVRSGFGLLDGGLIALMSKTFLYIPSSIWDIFKAYISAIVIIAMIVITIKAVVSIASAIGSALGLGK